MIQYMKEARTPLVIILIKTSHIYKETSPKVRSVKPIANTVNLKKKKTKEIPHQTWYQTSYNRNPETNGDVNPDSQNLAMTPIMDQKNLNAT